MTGGVWRVIEGDCIEQMAALDEGSVDAVVTDPPYGLGFMGKAWDSEFEPGDSPMRRSPALDAVNAGASRQGGRQRASADYQKRQARDARAFQEWCEAWALEALRVLRPGGYLLAFGGTRTYHRLAAGIEDAGFEVRDCIAWLYGSGFPKHASCLKPAHEPVVLARKSAPSATLLNIDACRIEGGERPVMVRTGTTVAANSMSGTSTSATSTGETTDTGRWPANVALDDEAAAMLDEQTGTLTSGSGPLNRNADKFRTAYGEFKGGDEPADVLYGDSGGASRFLYVAKPDQAERNVGLDGRNPHPTVKPVTFMRWLCRLITPPGGTVLDPFTGSGTTGIAALREGYSFVGIEQDPEYAQVARARIIGDAPLLNTFGEAA